MTITANLATGKLRMGETEFNISCKVRSLHNGMRKHDEVVRSIPHGLPYDPLPFPAGLWEITKVEWEEAYGFDRNVYGPVKIRTSAFQRVRVWMLDSDGDYLEESPKETDDYGYLLHYSPSSTTLGCIRIESPEEARVISKAIEVFMEQGEKIYLEVIR